MEVDNELLHLTERLLEHIKIVSNKYKEVKESGKACDFYSEVKPFADQVKNINDMWRNLAGEWVKTHGPSKIYIQQIESAHEHIQAVSVQAFFPETSKTRFYNYISSAEYVLNQVHERLVKVKGEFAE